MNQQVTLSSGSNTYTIATDSNGVYSLQATPDSYSLTITSPGNNGNNPSATNLPQHYQLYVGSSLISPLNQNVTGLDITIPAKKVVVHVQDSSNAAISGVEVDSNYIAESNLPAGSNYSASGQSAYLSSSYGFAPAKTDSTGDATLWLFPTEYPSSGYNLTAVPPAGSIYSAFTLSNVVITSNPVQNEIISLQYNHTSPVTTASLETQNQDGTYSDPTTVTLSATAASGYTIANTYYTIDGGSQQTYSSPFTVSGSGDHTITYWSVDNVGVPESPNTKTFTIHTNVAPTISPISGATINEGDTFTVSGSFTDSDSTSWTATVDYYGDGTNVLPLPLNPDKTFTLSNLYKDNGSYVVKVSITDNQGATATENIPVAVNNVNPTINSISVSPTNPQINQPITATSNFTDPSVLDTHIANIDWGDNSSSQCPSNSIDCTLNETNGSGSFTAAHTYTTFGTYTVTLKITDKDGGVGTQTKQIFVNSSPTANAGGPYSIAEGGSMPLNGTGSDPDGDTITYAWDLTGGTNFTTLGQTPIFDASTIDAPSTKTVNLQVCDNHGACSTSLATVNIFDPNPIVNPISVNTTLLTVNSSISTSTTFTDAINDTDTATWNWGDTNSTFCPPNTTDCTLTETSGSGSVTGNHTYIQTGVYQLSVTVKDENGVSTTQTYPDYIVVYDPSSGFVTGSGTITSPTGAEPTEPSVTGSATFGINAKYTNNQTVPTGTTMFSFPNGGFDFTSTSYDWMVVNGTTAYLHGTGTINGSSQTYTFLVSVVDGSPDTFRIKITDSSNTIIYDNQIGSGDNATPTEAIDHGQIKIH